MTKNSALSTDEVSALMAELGDEAPKFETSARGEVLSYVLGAEDSRPAPRLSGLERISERMARQMKPAIEALSRTRTQISFEPIETRRCEDWLADQREFTSLSLYRMHPLKGNMLIAVEPEFVISLVDAFYGGRGQVPPIKRNEFTTSENNMLGRITTMVIELMREGWADILALEPHLVSRETNPAYASLARPNDAVAIQRFTVAPGQGRPGVITLIYPLATLRPVESQLSVKLHDESEALDPEWRLRMAAALEQVRLPVRSVLARPELTVRQLMQLKVGDVIPITLPVKVPLLVAQKRLAEGTIGEQDGRAALLIENMDKGTGR